LIAALKLRHPTPAPAEAQSGSSQQLDSALPELNLLVDILRGLTRAIVDLTMIASLL
jgi:hypothetical protein